MQRQLRHNDQLPDWIEHSTSMMAVVFDNEGEVHHVNSSCSIHFNLDEYENLKKILAFSTESPDLPIDMLGHFDSENSHVLNLWMESESSCVALGYGWEISPLVTQSGQLLIALKPTLSEKLQEGSLFSLSEREMLTDEHILKQRMQGFLFSFEVNGTGERQFTFISPGIAKFLHLDAYEVVKNTVDLFEMVDPLDRMRLEESIIESREQQSIWEQTFRFVNPQGTIHWVQGIAAPQKREDGSTYWSGFISDVTERISFQDRLLKQQHELEEIAFLQAHEFRRPVANLLGLFDLIEMQLKDETSSLEQIQSLLGLMKISVKEADSVIASIVQKTTGSKLPLY